MKRGISFGIIATICLLFIAIPNARSTHFSGVYQLFDCGQVENLTASTIGYNTATIQWEPAPGAVAYNVRIAADGQETIINIIEGNTYTFENLLPNTTYTVTITAMCLIEGSLVSSIISVQYTFTTESEPTPSCGLPSKPAVNRITDNSAIVSWFADPNAIGYNLVYYAKETVPTQITLEGTSYELLFLTPNTEYTVEIFSICNLDSVPTQNDQGTTFTFTTEGTQLNCQPNAYEANNSIATASRMSIDNIGIDAMIEAPKGETKDLDYYSFVAPARGSFLVAKLKNLTKNYNLSIFNADGILQFSSKNGGTTPEIISFRFLTNQTYYVLVEPNAFSDYDERSCYNLTVQETSLLTCDMPTNLVANNITLSQANLTWSNIPLALQYRLSYRIAGTTPWTDILTAANSALVTGLQPNTTYEWKVKTICTSDSSAFSPVSIFNTTPVNIGCVDNYEINNQISQPMPFMPMFTDFQAKLDPNSDVDFFKFYNPYPAANISVTLKNLPSNYDLRLYRNQLPVDTSETAGLANETVTYTATSADTFRIRVYKGNGGAGSTTCYTLNGQITPISCDIPTNLATSNPTINGFTATWTAVAGVSYYILEYKTLTGGTWTPVTPNPSTNTYTFNNLNPNTTYQLRVKACCTNNLCSDYSAVINASTASCGIPQNLAHSNVTTNSFTVSWNAVPSATGYILEYRTVGGTWNQLPSTPNTSATINGLGSGVTYEYRVKAICSPTISGDYSMTGTVTTVALNCDVPTNLTASNQTLTGFTISWNAVTGVSYYVVEYKASSSSTWIPLPNQTTTTYTFTNLSPNTTYNVHVKACCTNNACSNFSSDINATTANCAIPQNVNHTNLTANSFTVNWTAVPLATSYIVEYKTTSGNWTPLPATTATSQNITNLTPNTAYQYRVKANCSPTISGDYSTIGNVTTLANSSCPIPTGLNVTNITQNTAQLNWTAVPGAIGYNLEWGPAGGPFNSLIINNPTANSYNLSGLSAATNYEFKLRTVCITSLSDYSVTVPFTTLGGNTCNTTTLNATTNITSTTATINWTAVSGAISYNIQYRIQGAANWSNTTSNTNSKNLINLDPGKTYEFQVQTVCTIGTSNFTNSGTFSTPALATCGTPTITAITNITNSQANVAWSAVPNATTYTVEYRIFGQTWQNISTPNTSALLQGLTANKTYEVRITAVCPSATGTPSLSQFFSTTQTNTTCTDTEEPNNQIGDPMPTIPIWQDYKARLNPNSDVDFFQFENPFANATIKVTLSQLPSNYDLRLYRISTQVAEQTTSGLVDEVITYPNADANIYKIRVFKGTNGAGSTSCYNLKVEISLPPCGVASGLSVTDISQTSAKLQWAAVPNASSYNISYNKIGETPTIVTSNTNFVVVSNLVANTNYEFKVEAICPNGSNGYSTSFPFTTLALSCNDTYEANETQATAASIAINTDIFAKLFPTPPAATDIDFFKFTNPVANTTITVTLSDLPSNYDLRLYKQGGVQVAESTNAGNLNEIISYPNAAIGEYKIRVIKGTNGQFSPNCYTLKVTINVPNCGDVTGLNASQITQNTATLNWTAVPNATTYNVQWRIVGTTTWSTGNANTNSLPISGLTANSTYEFQVQAVCTAGAGNFSPSTTFQTSSSNGCNDTYEPNETQATAAQISINTNIQAKLFPTPPDNTDVDFFKFTNPSANTTITVTLSNLPSNYDLRLYKPGGVQVGESTNSGTLNDVITYGNADAGEYKVRVIKATGAQYSPDCYTLNVNINLPNCGDVSGLNATLITQTTATLNWTAVPNAISYNVQWRKVGTTTWSTGTATTNSLPISGLTAGTNYEFQVQSVCTAGTGNFSASANFTTVSISGCSDTYEDNNTSADAKPIPVGTAIQALIDVNSDVDWYYFDNNLLASSIKVSLTNLPKNYNVSLHKGTQLSISENSGTLNEFIDYPTSDIGTYRVKVFRDPNCNNQCFSATECYTLQVDLYSATCTPPSGLNVTQITQNTATLNWNAVSSAVGYIVQYRRIGTINWVGPLPATTNSLNIDALLPDSTYEFQVKSVCGAEESIFSLLDTFTTAGWASCINSLEPNNGQAAAIPIPLNTDIKSMIQTGNDQDWFSFSSAVGQTYVKVSLTNLPKNYNIFLYRKLPGTPLEQVGSGTNSGTANEEIILATSWQADYFVKIVGDNVNFSDVECYTLKAEIYNGPPVCEAPVNVTVSEITAISAKVCWQPVPNALFYYIRWINNSAPIGFYYYDTISGPNPDTCIVISGLLPKKNYTVEIKADCGFNIGNYGSINFSTPNAAICSQNSFENNNQQGNAFPYNLAVPTIESMIEDPNDVDWFSFSNTTSQRSIKVNLSGMPSNYDVELYKETPTGGVSFVASSTNIGITDELIDYQPPYSDPVGVYKMKIITPFGGWNNADCYTLGISIYNKPYVCTTPTGLNATNITQTTAQLNWNAVPDAASYEIDFRKAPFGIWQTTTSTSNNVIVTGLSINTVYQYRVRTVCIFGSTSSNSSIANFTTKNAGDCVKDAYEPNNQASVATNLPGIGIDIKAMIEIGSDNDWYSFTTDLTNPSIKINLSTLPQNYNLELYKANNSGGPGTTPVASSNNVGTQSEFINYSGPNVIVGKYFIKILSEGTAHDDINCYTLNVQTYPAPATCDDPSNLSASDLTPISAILNWTGDVDATKYIIRYRKIGDPNWIVIEVLAPTTSVFIQNLSPSIQYEFQVQSYCDFGSSNFTASSIFTTPFVGCAFNIYEPNNGPGTATTLPVTTEIQAMIEEAGDQDVFLLQTTAANPHCKIYLSNLPKDYDLYLYKQGASGGWISFPDNPIAVSDNNDLNDEFIERLEFGPTLYLVRVVGKNPQSYTAQKCYTLKAELFNGPITCPQVKNLKVTRTGSSYVDLEWDPVQFAIGYTIEYMPLRGPARWPTWFTYESTTDNFYHADHYLSGEACYFRVKALCQNLGDGPFSDSVLAIFQPEGACDLNRYEVNNEEPESKSITLNRFTSSLYPENIEAMIEYGTDQDWFVFTTPYNSWDGDGKVIVSLTNMTRDYDLKVVKPGGGTFESTNFGINDEKITFDVDHNKTYNIRVKGKQPNDPNAPSPNWDTTACYRLNAVFYKNSETPICKAPQKIWVVKLMPDYAMVAWSAVNTASEYEVQYRLAGSGNWATLSTHTTSMTITGLTPGATYLFRVRAKCVFNNGWGDYTGVSPFKLPITLETCQDQHEFDGEVRKATVLNTGGMETSAISSPQDADYYIYNKTLSTLKFELTGPAGLAFGVQYDKTDPNAPQTGNTSVGGSSQTGSNNDNVQTFVKTGLVNCRYFITVYGSYGAYNENYCYTLKDLSFNRLAAPGTYDENNLVEEKFDRFNIFPNPNSGKFTLDYWSAKDNIIHVKVFDISGKIHFDNQIHVSKGDNVEQINLNELSSGIYLLNINNGGDELNQKIIIQR